jgi:hypothetical protein
MAYIYKFALKYSKLKINTISSHLDEQYVGSKNNLFRKLIYFYYYYCLNIFNLYLHRFHGM